MSWKGKKKHPGQAAAGALAIPAVDVDFGEELTVAIADSAADAAQEAGQQLGMGSDEIADAQADAREWAAEHAGELLDQLGDTTAAVAQAAAEKAAESGASLSEIVEAVESAWVFSDKRAGVIAETESARADAFGTLLAAHKGGVEKKVWGTLAGCCPTCSANEAAGAIPIDEEFPSGDQAPPGHPNCRCALMPVYDAEENE